MRSCYLLLLPAISLAGCDASCDTDRAISIAKRYAASKSYEVKQYAVRVNETPSMWEIEFYRPDAGTGGHAFFKIDKRRCEVVDWIGFQ